MKRSIALIVALLVCLSVSGFAGRPLAASGSQRNVSNGIGGTPVDPPAQPVPYIQGGTYGPVQLDPGEATSLGWAIGSRPYNWVAVCSLPVTVVNSSPFDIPVAIAGLGPNFATFAPNNATCKAASPDGTPNICEWTVATEYTSATPAPTDVQWNGISVENNGTAGTLDNVTIEIDCVAYPAMNQFGPNPPWF